MSQATPSIVCTIIVCLVLIHGNSASNTFKFKNKELANQQPQLSEQELKSLLPSIEERPVRPITMDREDYHSNIELDKINDAHRYDMLDGGGGAPATTLGFTNMGGNQFYAPNSPDIWKFGRFVVNRNRLPSNYFGKRDTIYDATKEDKDYSFVGQSNKINSDPNYEQASGFAPLNSEMLRDLLIATRAQGRARNLDQLSQAYARRIIAEVAGNKLSAAAASNREKRRRCKVDPNMGVKNPSFCDTDAYFGAADYSMRDVWDSAGR